MKSISGKDISAADPEELIEAYAGLIDRIVSSYERMTARTGAIDKDDLLQEARLAILAAQKTYNQEKNPSFATWAILHMKHRIRYAVGYRSNGTRKPEPELVLDADTPGAEEGTALIDIIPDESIEDNTERIIRAEQAAEVRNAVNRLKNDKQKAVINGLYFKEQKPKEIEKETGISTKQIKGHREKAIANLRNDWRLRKYVLSHRLCGSIGRFRITGNSSVEAEILELEKEYDLIYGSGAYANSGRRVEDD